MINNLFEVMKEGKVCAEQSVTDFDFGRELRAGNQAATRMDEESFKCKPLVREVEPQNPGTRSRNSVGTERHNPFPREISSNGMRIEQVSVIVFTTSDCLTPRRVVDEFDFSWHETVA